MILVIFVILTSIGRTMIASSNEFFSGGLNSIVLERIHVKIDSMVTVGEAPRNLIW